MPGWLKDLKYPAILTVLGFVLVVAGLFDINDITRLDIESSSSPRYAAVVIGVIMIATAVGLTVWGARGVAPASSLSSRSTRVLPHSLFLSAPMNSYVIRGRSDEYQQSRSQLLALIRAFKRHCRIEHVFYAGENIDTPAQFELPGGSLRHDFQKIEEHEFFVLFWPDQFASRSCLIEFGIALTLDKKCLIFTPDLHELPFLLQQAQHATHNVKVIEYEQPADLPGIVERNSTTILDFDKLGSGGAAERRGVGPRPTL